MRFVDEISARLAALSGASADDARQALNEFDVRDIQAVRVSEGGGGGGSQTVQTATVTLDNDAIIALPTTQIEVVAAPGTGKALLLLGGLAQLTMTNAGQYGLAEGASDPQLAIAYGGLGGADRVSAYIGDGSLLVTDFGANLSQLIAVAPALLRGGSGDYTNQMYTNQLAPGVTPGGENAAWMLRDDDNNGGSPYTGGDTGNSLKLTVYYATVTL